MIVTNYQQAKVRLDHDGIRISFGEVFFFTGLVLRRYDIDCYALFLYADFLRKDCSDRINSA